MEFEDAEGKYTDAAEVDLRGSRDSIFALLLNALVLSFGFRCSWIVSQMPLHEMLIDLVDDVDVGDVDVGDVDIHGFDMERIDVREKIYQTFLRD